MWKEAALFYESRMAGLGKSFAAEVDRTIELLWSGSFLKQVHRWVQSGAEFSWRGTRIQSSIGRIQTPLSSSRWPINAGGQVTGGGANSTLTARRTRTRARPQRLIKCHAARAGGRGR